jgi:malate dehydrogenase (oxaloacetate-decarboxylating)
MRTSTASPSWKTIKAVKPTILIGICGQTHLFTEGTFREMAKHVDPPIVFRLSNPTSRADAQPMDILTWTAGRAIIGTGSPFASVKFGGKTFPIAHTNNVYIFCGLGISTLALVPAVIDFAANL